MDSAGDQNQVQPYVEHASHKDNDEGAAGKGLQQFHPLHGSNIQLKNDSTLAYVLNYDSCLSTSGLMYTKQPLKASEIFMMEIEKTAADPWAVITLGLTKQEPFNNLRIVLNLLPDLIHPHECVRILCAAKPILETSQLGIVYKPLESNATHSVLHIIANGMETCPADTIISLGEGPLYVVMHVQGSVKNVRIIQKNAVLSLQNACRSVLRDNFTTDEIMYLQLPTNIKSFLLTRDY